MYVPALSIVAIVLLLLVLIGISTYRNLDREKKTALEFVHRQGLALMRSLEAGARAGMMMPMWQEDSIGILIKETRKSEDIAYIYLFDKQGIALHHTDPSKDGKRVDWRPELLDDSQLEGRVWTLGDGSRVYELAKRFTPLPPPPQMLEQHSMMGHKISAHVHPDAVLVLGLKMTAFEEAQSSDIHHALIMSAILLALGTGALFFIFVIQNYYLVDRTLKETEDYTAQVVASMANGLLSIDPQGKVVSFNRLALGLLGLKESELRAVNLREVIDFQASGVHETLIKCTPVLDQEINHRSPTGEQVPLAVSATPILGEEGVCRGAVIILRDLREIKRLEEQVRRSEKLAAVGKLAAGVAHEIRNPLSSIRGFAQFLRHALVERPKDQEYAEIMVKEVDRINRVVTDLLTFARPMEAELAPTDLKELIGHTLRLVEADAQRREVVIHENISPTLGNVAVDPNQMTQALLNLMLNGVQAMSVGGNLEVGAALDDAGSRLHIWVEDDGPGVSSKHLAKIFDPFFTTREKGTGLGLAIIHTIVENHRGEVMVESPPPGKNRGSRFTLSIPVDYSEIHSVQAD
jgi:two-component system sensor histidine kinase HydH